MLQHLGRLAKVENKEDIRCGHCYKKLAYGNFIELHIKCARCKTLNILKAGSLKPRAPCATNNEG